jgi:hypothetical protein
MSWSAKCRAFATGSPERRNDFAQPVVSANAGQAPPVNADALGPAWLHSAFGNDIMRTVACLIAFVAIACALEAAEEEFPVYTPRTSVAGPRADQDFPIVDTDAYKGAIVPAEEAARHRHLAKRYEGFWTPTPADIEKAEARLKTYLEAQKDKWSADALTKLPRYRRQYVGHTTSGEKRVLCSFLPGVKKGEDPFAGIRRSFIKVYDGGPSFWQIDYRLDADECVDLRVDGGY